MANTSSSLGKFSRVCLFGRTQPLVDSFLGIDYSFFLKETFSVN